MNDKQSSKPGPKEDRLQIDGNWKDVLKKAIKKPKPEGGWPEPEEGKDKAKDD